MRLESNTFHQISLIIAMGSDKVLIMLMKLVKKIFEDSGLSQYQFAKQLGVSIQIVQYWIGKVGGNRPRSSIKLESLCKLRKMSGLSWEQFGKRIDQEFGE